MQGMEKPDPKHTMAWQELLFRRLLGLFADVPTGVGTAAAEAALGFDEPMTYYYVGRCVPAFGHNVIASRPTLSTSSTTPFDTGALVDPRGWMATNPELDAVGRAALVTAHTYMGRDYEPQMDDWLAAAYSAPTEYVEGERPEHHAVPGVVLEECIGDARIWTWEGRLPAVDYDNPPTEPVVVLFASGTREPYIDWVQTSDLLTADERLTHMRDVYRYSEEVADPAPLMLEYLSGELMS